MAWTDCGVRPRWPITGISASRIARTASSRLRPPSSFTAPAPGADQPRRVADGVVDRDVVAEPRQVADDQRARAASARRRRRGAPCRRSSPAACRRTRARPSRASRRRGSCRRRRRRRSRADGASYAVTITSGVPPPLRARDRRGSDPALVEPADSTVQGQAPGTRIATTGVSAIDLPPSSRAPHGSRRRTARSRGSARDAASCSRGVSRRGGGRAARGAGGGSSGIRCRPRRRSRRTLRASASSLASSSGGLDAAAVGSAQRRRRRRTDTSTQARRARRPGSRRRRLARGCGPPGAARAGRRTRRGGPACRSAGRGAPPGGRVRSRRDAAHGAECRRERTEVPAATGTPERRLDAYVDSIYRSDISGRYMFVHSSDITRHVPYPELRSPMLELAVLGLLKEQPLHGYELKKRLSDTLGFLWGVSLRLALSGAAPARADGAIEVVDRARRAPAPIAATGSLTGDLAAARRGAGRTPKPSRRTRKAYRITDRPATLASSSCCSPTTRTPTKTRPSPSSSRSAVPPARRPVSSCSSAAASRSSPASTGPARADRHAATTATAARSRAPHPLHPARPRVGRRADRRRARRQPEVTGSDPSRT